MSSDYYRRPGLMGPAILITIGSLFLLERWRYEYGFHNLWPVILIVIGLVRLFEGGRRGCDPAPAPGAVAAAPPPTQASGQSSSGESSDN